LFNLSHPDLSQKILERPLTDLDSSGAEVIATSCMACLMQFKLGVQRTGRKVKVKHWAELMV
ncbi:MAG: (Fe-S)-binding protein, partial [Thermodesulfobacteriota bacterium]